MRGVSTVAYHSRETQRCFLTDLMTAGNTDKWSNIEHRGLVLDACGHRYGVGCNSPIINTVYILGIAGLTKISYLCVLEGICSLQTFHQICFLLLTEVRFWLWDGSNTARQYLITLPEEKITVYFHNSVGFVEWFKPFLNQLCFFTVIPTFLSTSLVL